MPVSLLTANLESECLDRVWLDTLPDILRVIRVLFFCCFLLLLTLFITMRQLHCVCLSGSPWRDQPWSEQVLDTPTLHASHRYPVCPDKIGKLGHSICSNKLKLVKIHRGLEPWKYWSKNRRLPVSKSSKAWCNVALNILPRSYMHLRSITHFNPSVI